MSRFPDKRLPPHWLYIPSRREIRELLRGLAADVRRVDLDGTGSGLHSGRLLLGYLEHRVADGAWCFYLRLWGVPESEVTGRRDALAREAALAIGQSVAEVLSLPAVEEAKPTQLLLSFAVDDDGVIPGCRLKPVDRYSFSVGDWWVRPG